MIAPTPAFPAGKPLPFDGALDASRFTDLSLAGEHRVDALSGMVRARDTCELGLHACRAPHVDLPRSSPCMAHSPLAEAEGARAEPSARLRRRVHMGGVVRGRHPHRVLRGCSFLGWHR